MSENEVVYIDAVRKLYAEAFNFICGDKLLRNPQKDFAILHNLADDEFAAASFYSVLMLCMGIGAEKNVDKGKELLKAQEKILGYTTKIVMEQSGLFNELSPSEQLQCIDYWISNHQLADALYLKSQCTCA